MYGEKDGWKWIKDTLLIPGETFELTFPSVCLSVIVLKRETEYMDVFQRPRPALAEQRAEACSPEVCVYAKWPTSRWTQETQEVATWRSQ